MSDEKTFNAGDEAQVGKRKRKEDFERLQEVADLKAVLSIVEGRRFIWGLLGDPAGKSGVFQSTFNTNALAMAFNEGARSRGLKLLSEVADQFPDLYLLMQSEAANLTKQEKENDN